MKLERSIDGYAGGAFFPWAHQIVLNLHRDQERVRARRSELRAANQRAVAEHPVRQVRNAVDAVEAFLHHLTEAQRTAFQLVDLEGWSTSQVAESLDLAESTVRVHLMRARATLRARILEEWIP